MMSNVLLMSVQRTEEMRKTLLSRRLRPQTTIGKYWLLTIEKCQSQLHTNQKCTPYIWHMHSTHTKCTAYLTHVVGNKWSYDDKDFSYWWVCL